MSPKTRSKVKKYLSVWLNGIKFAKQSPEFKGKEKPYITFITLTLASKQVHDDNEIKRELLNPFIVWLRNSCGIKYYFWRAEPQENGNIHFHLICDKYIQWQFIRKKWNQIQNKLGYVDAYQEKHRHMNWSQYWQHCQNQYQTPNRTRAFKAWSYGSKSGWNDPNSTDIHKIGKIRDIVGYVIKYVAKEPKRDEEERIIERKIEGRIWGASDSIRNLKPYQELVGGHAAALLYRLENSKDIKCESGKYHHIFMVPNAWDYLKTHAPVVYNDMVNHHIDQYKMLYHPPPPEKIVEQEVFKPPDIEELEVIQIELF